LLLFAAKATTTRLVQSHDEVRHRSTLAIETQWTKCCQTGYYLDIEGNIRTQKLPAIRVGTHLQC
jgi:hypothetical protein